MKRWMIGIAALLAIGLAAPAASALELGKVPPAVQLSGDKGGRVDGTPWASSEISGKVYTVMYVDPDAKDLNTHVEDALKAENFPKDFYGSMAIINMEATWKPNAIINSILRKKQQKFPDTIYVRDMDYYVADAWGLKKNGSYAVLCFDSDGRLIFMKDGKLSDADVKTLIEAIHTALAPFLSEEAPLEEEPAPEGD